MDKKTHVLCQELIVIIDEIDAEAEEIVREHLKGCQECQQLYNKIHTEISFPQQDIDDGEIEIKPLKKLAQFNVGLRVFVVAIRILILFYITFSAFQYHDTESYWITLNYIHSGILLFYIPAALFLLVFSFVFLNKRWVWILGSFDLIVVFFLSFILRWFL